MITLDSIGKTYVTLNADDGLEAGQVCKITADSTVGPCSAGDDFCGYAQQVRLALAGVVLDGYCCVPYSGTAPALGRTALCADGQGGVKAGGTTKYLVAHVDTSAQVVGFFL